MNTTRLSAVLALATTAGITGCCGAEEQHAVTVSAPGFLSVTRDGVTRQIESVFRITDPPTPPATFDFIFNTLEGSTSGEGIALTVGGNDPVSDELVSLTLALPVTLRSGDQYPVGATFSTDPGVNDARLIGQYDLQQPNQAEAAFTISTYTFPPGVYNATFRATTSTGTIRVTQRERGRVELTLNLSFTDAAGKTVTVTGPMQAVTESVTPPCYS
jgi:hypothetical protein